jgi:hypothetical protein
LALRRRKLLKQKLRDRGGLVRGTVCLHDRLAHRSDVHRVVVAAMVDMDGVVSTNDIVRMTGFSGRIVEFVWRDLRADAVVKSDTVCRYSLVRRADVCP